jgi:DNA-directed RNA polymerase specialized sigma24 family protein
MTNLERNICAKQFLRTILTSHERLLVAAFALGFTQAEIATRWGVSAAAVSQMTRRVRLKAARFWH